MQAFRTHGQDAKATTGLNPSTQRLMSRYLQQSDSFVRRVGNVNHRSKNQVGGMFIIRAGSMVDYHGGSLTFETPWLGLPHESKKT